MRFLLSSVVLVAALVTLAQAHAPYIVAEGSDPAKAVLVFSDDLHPDDRIKEATWKKMANLKLTARDAAGKTTDVKWSMGEHCLKCAAPAGTQTITGSVVYGTFAKGDAKPQLLMYYPKAILGAIPANGGAIPDAALDVLPKVEGGKVRFQVMLKGKPLAGAKLTVLLPEGGTEKSNPATTDEQGLTQAFDAKGRYGVTVRVPEAKTGEQDGVKYETVLHVATLVVDVK